MNRISQGKITKLTASGSSKIKANITDTSGIVITDAVIPERLRPLENLSIGISVAVAVFDDNTALMLSRLDGLYS